MKINKNTIKYFKFLFILAIFVFSSLKVFAVWTPPSFSPSNGNTYPPLNISISPQQKTGSFIASGGFRSIGPVILDTTLQIPTNAGTNKVLTSDAQGNATWQTPTSSGGGDTWTRDSGTSTVRLTTIGDKVGIGTNTPNNKLQVSGLINFFTDSTGTTARSTAIGKDTLPVNASTDNTGFGFNALNVNSSGNNNTAIGTNALKSNTTGSYNTALGVGALENSTNTISSTAIGFQALQNHSDHYSTAVGYQSGKNSRGGSNLSIGSQSLILNNASPYNGSSNVAIGYNTLSSQTIAYSNIAVGSGALSRVTTGSNNTGIGAGADVSVGSGNINNATAVGYNANVTASNTMVFGNSSVVGWGFGAVNPTIGVDAIKVSANLAQGASLTVLGTWTSASDLNKKTNIQNINYGLNQVLKLRPVSFNWKDSNKHDIGFIAQEVKEIIPELVHGKEGDLSLSYSQMPVILTRAIQEQQEEIEGYRQELEELKIRLKALQE